jgi:hypothetical protein
VRAFLLSLLPCVVAAVGVPASGQEMPQASEQFTRASRLNPTEQDEHERRLWRWSLVALIGATAFDAGTSMNNPEANPLLRSSSGRFGYRGLLLKSSLATATVAFEFHFGRTTHGYKRFAILNFIEAGAFVGAGIHNLHTGR